MLVAQALIGRRDLGHSRHSENKVGGCGPSPSPEGEAQVGGCVPDLGWALPQVGGQRGIKSAPSLEDPSD